MLAATGTAQMLPCGEMSKAVTAAEFEMALDEHAAVLARTRAACLPALAGLATRISGAIEAGGKILFFGNGGSAADAQHLAAELAIRYLKDRPALPALALTTDSSVLTACANDLGYENVFARQVEALGRQGDIAIGISTSGASPNVLAGLRRARGLGLYTAALVGERTDAVTPLADLVLAIPSRTTARVQEMHILLGHMLCEQVEARLAR
jgi:D-sedoheptulose 7-phosphate isomerase